MRVTVSDRSAAFDAVAATWRLSGPAWYRVPDDSWVVGSAKGPPDGARRGHGGSARSGQLSKSGGGGYTVTTADGTTYTFKDRGSPASEYYDLPMYLPPEDDIPAETRRWGWECEADCTTEEEEEGAPADGCGGGCGGSSGGSGESGGGYGSCGEGCDDGDGLTGYDFDEEWWDTEDFQPFASSDVVIPWATGLSWGMGPPDDYDGWQGLDANFPGLLGADDGTSGGSSGPTQPPPPTGGAPSGGTSGGGSDILQPEDYVEPLDWRRPPPPNAYNIELPGALALVGPGSFPVGLLPWWGPFLDGPQPGPADAAFLALLLLVWAWENRFPPPAAGPDDDPDDEGGFTLFPHPGWYPPPFRPPMTEEECDHLYAQYKFVCDHMRQRCTPEMTCEELLNNQMLHDLCAYLRGEWNQYCFTDDGHEDAEEAAENGALRCMRFYLDPRREDPCT